MASENPKRQAVNVGANATTQDETSRSKKRVAFSRTVKKSAQSSKTDKTRFAQSPPSDESSLGLSKTRLGRLPQRDEHALATGTREAAHTKKESLISAALARLNETCSRQQARLASQSDCDSGARNNLTATGEITEGFNNDGVFSHHVSRQLESLADLERVLTRPLADAQIPVSGSLDDRSRSLYHDKVPGATLGKRMSDFQHLVTSEQRKLAGLWVEWESVVDDIREVAGLLTGETHRGGQDSQMQNADDPREIEECFRREMEEINEELETIAAETEKAIEAEDQFLEEDRTKFRKRFSTVLQAQG